MNKKGFTLIELLSVIALLGLLFGLAVPGISKIKSNIEKRKEKKVISLAESAGVLWGQDNKTRLRKSTCNIDSKEIPCFKITIDELKNQNYFDTDTSKYDNYCMYVYKRNNRVYTKYVKEDSECDNNLQDLNNMGEESNYDIRLDLPVINNQTLLYYFLQDCVKNNSNNCINYINNKNTSYIRLKILQEIENNILKYIIIKNKNTGETIYDFTNNDNISIESSVLDIKLSKDTALLNNINIKGKIEFLYNGEKIIKTINYMDEIDFDLFLASQEYFDEYINYLKSNKTYLNYTIFDFPKSLYSNKDDTNYDKLKIIDLNLANYYKNIYMYRPILINRFDFIKCNTQNDGSNETVYSINNRAFYIFELINDISIDNVSYFYHTTGNLNECQNNITNNNVVSFNFEGKIIRIESIGSEPYSTYLSVHTSDKRSNDVYFSKYDYNIAHNNNDECDNSEEMYNVINDEGYNEIGICDCAGGCSGYMFSGGTYVGKTDYHDEYE